MYTLAYRNLGIFQENVVNRVLADVVKAAQPLNATVEGEFPPRGGVYTKITARYASDEPRSRKRSRCRTDSGDSRSARPPAGPAPQRTAWIRRSIRGRPHAAG